MDPFFIACTTCQVQLKVRDPSVVGQILTCPKCGSMVLVSAPNAVADGDPPSDSGSIPASEGSAHAGQVPLPPERPQSAASSAADRVFHAGETDALPVLPTDEWVSDSSQMWRSWLQRGVAICVGIGLAITLFGFVALQLRGRSNTGQTGDLAAASGTKADFAETPIPLEPAAETVPSAMPTVQDPPVAAIPVPATDEIPPAPETSVESNGATNEVVQTPEASPGVAEQPSATAPAAPTAAPAGGAPPGFVAGGADDPDVGATFPGGRLTDMLREVDELLLDSEARPPVALLPDETPTEEASLPRPPALEIDRDERLQDVIAQVDCDNAALLDLVRFLSDFSTIPITLHAESLIWLRLSPETPVTIHAKDHTVGALLGEVLSELGLEYTASGQTLLIRRPPTSDPSGLREGRFSVSDLVGSDAGQLVETITSVIAPATWTAVGGGGGTIAVEDGVLVVHQPDALLFEVLFFCEKLRVARGLSTLSHYEPELFDPRKRAAREKELLSRRVTLTFLDETPLETVIRRFEQAGKLRILIDWQSLGELGWNTQTQLKYQVYEQPLGTALRDLLNPMDLDFRVAGERFLQVSGRRTLSNLLSTECYPAGDWLAARGGGDGAVAELRELLGAELFQETGGPSVLLRDPGSKVLVLRATDQTQQQLMSLLFDAGVPSMVGD